MTLLPLMNNIDTISYVILYFKLYDRYRVNIVQDFNFSYLVYYHYNQVARLSYFLMHLNITREYNTVHLD